MEVIIALVIIPQKFNNSRIVKAANCSNEVPFALVQFSRLWFVNITKILFLFFSFFMELFLFLKFALN